MDRDRGFRQQPYLYNGSSEQRDRFTYAQPTPGPVPYSTYQPTGRPTAPYGAPYGKPAFGAYGQPNQFAQNQRPYGYGQPVYPGYPPYPPEEYGYEEEEPEEEEKKPSIIRRILFILAILLLLTALGFAGYIAYTYWHGQYVYDKWAEENLDVTDTSSAPTLAAFNVDWDALRAVNSDVVAWVYVPDTIINYPVVWRENDDSFYMTHNFGRNSVGGFGAEYGCVALASANNPKFTDQASYFSGHHMRNGSMFALFARFTNSEEFNKHRTIYVLTPEGNFKLTTFACNKVRGTSNDVIIPNFESRQKMTEYIQERMDTSYANPDPAPIPAADMEQIMMFYTCSEPDNQYRICVYASVDEFVPTGSNRPQKSSLVNQDDVSTVQNAISERTM